MTSMRGIDAAFLAMERPDEPRHLGSLMIFEPSDLGPLDRDAVAAALEARLPTMRSARRVVVPSTSGLTRPSWRMVERVDLEVHLRSATLPADEDPRRALDELVARLHAEPLDRRRPLWQMHVIGGLPDDRVAVYAKVHMAAIDDETGVELMTALLDHDPGGRPTMEDVEILSDPANRLLDRMGPVSEQVRRGIGFPGRLIGRTARAVGEQLPGLGATATEVAHRWPGMEAFARLLPSGTGDDEHPTGRAPRLTFNEPIGPRRVYAMGTLPIEQLIAVRAAADVKTSPVSFHAVVLAACTGGLRRWLLARNELPTSPIVAVVPVLARGENDADAHVAGIMVALPTHLADPVKRLQATARNLENAKERYGEIPVSLAQDIAMFAPPAVAALANRLDDAMPHRQFISPTVNLGITNVPGPRRQVFLAGRPLRTSHPVLTVSDITPLHLGVQGGATDVGLGAVADGDAIDDLTELVDAFGLELSELAAAYETGGSASS
ncbi:wax ester/triacylglycerol synthase domain-containing protein [Ilumatobacter nonamiensis]|uniref:wax ester/triacylglycerol synthase domain-containing protein n=1 Tax=Ilumatobacter nonamiensis TaxID=467093 RepID=UPI0003457228|nr:wax ester/triacylglycerol synthase domain-containing protein [Ilumatobacter nonamiensis]